MKNGFDFPFVITVFLYGHSHHLRFHHFRPYWISSDKRNVSLLVMIWASGRNLQIHVILPWFLVMAHIVSIAQCGEKYEKCNVELSATIRSDWRDASIWCPVPSPPLSPAPLCYLLLWLHQYEYFLSPLHIFLFPLIHFFSYFSILDWFFWGKKIAHHIKKTWKQKCKKFAN